MTVESLPVSFRKHEVDKIIGFLLAGESCTIISIGSVGKSNLLRFFLQEDVQRSRFPEAWEKIVFVYVDINKLIEANEWGLFELMVHQLFIELSNRGVAEADLRELDALYHHIIQGAETRKMALRYLEKGVDGAAGVGETGASG